MCPPAVPCHPPSKLILLWCYHIDLPNDWGKGGSVIVSTIRNVQEQVMWNNRFRKSCKHAAATLCKISICKLAPENLSRRLHAKETLRQHLFQIICFHFPELECYRTSTSGSRQHLLVLKGGGRERYVLRCIYMALCNASSSGYNTLCATNVLLGMLYPETYIGKH